MSVLTAADERGIQNVLSGCRKTETQVLVGTIQPIADGFKVERDGFNEEHEQKGAAVKALINNYRTSGIS